ncbi:MAG: hypothetical protein ABI939_08155 [Anaerolineaceae bacterium]
MVKHVSYTQANYTTSEDCVSGIREYVDLGWRVSQIRGTRHGPFAVLFRMDGKYDGPDDRLEHAQAACGKCPDMSGRGASCLHGRGRFWSSKRI